MFSQYRTNLIAVVISIETEASLLALAKAIYYFKAFKRTETGLTEQKKEYKKKSTSHCKVIYCSCDLCRACGLYRGSR